ncbi:MAG: GtrA family protein [Candidatus Woesebacteria bacterium]|jgi:dolichol-phosphate mannosyltransferase
MKQLLRVDFVRFCIVGATGFAANFIILTMLFKVFGWPIFIAQLVASEISLFSNFILHDRWTYKHKTVTKTISQLLIQFHISSWMAILGSALLVAFMVDRLNWSYVIALMVSSAIAMIWNFSWTKFVIWRNEQEALKGENHEN